VYIIQDQKKRTAFSLKEEENAPVFSHQEDFCGIPAAAPASTDKSGPSLLSVT